MIKILLQTFTLLLPALFPSWRFFKTVAPSPRVEWRAQNTPNWQEARPRPDQISFQRQLRRMLWNPHWNEALYLVSLSERQITEPTDYVEKELRARVMDCLPDDVEAFEFRLTFVARVDHDIVNFVEYESGMIKRGEKA